MQRIYHVFYPWMNFPFLIFFTIETRIWSVFSLHLFFVDIGNLSFPATMIFWNGFFRWGHYFFFNGVFNWGHLTFSFIFLKQGHVLPSPSVNILVVFFRMLISAFISNTNLCLPFILLKCQVQHVSRPFSNFYVICSNIVTCALFI